MDLLGLWRNFPLVCSTEFVGDVKRRHEKGTAAPVSDHYVIRGYTRRAGFFDKLRDNQLFK
jgi:hypothetical protein